MPNFETCRQAVAEYFAIPDTLEPNTPVAGLATDWEDWNELGLHLEDRLSLDLSVDAWNELGGAPEPGRAISPEVTLDDVSAFVQTQPILDVGRIVKKTLAEFLGGKDPDTLPDDLVITCSARRWMDLRTKLEARLGSWQVELKHEGWNQLGRQEAPRVEQIVEFVVDAQPALPMR